MRPLSDLPLFGSLDDFRATKALPGQIQYPNAPGFKTAGGASQEAAAAVASRVPRLRGIVLAAFHDAPAGLTADEAAEMLSLSILSVRPRVAELHRLGELRPAEERRKNSSGMSATVWRIADPLPLAPDAPTIQSKIGEVK
jgi:hypothetical protein